MAQTLNIDADFVGRDPAALFVNGKIFYAHGLTDLLIHVGAGEAGVTACAYYIKNPNSGEAASFDKIEMAASLEKEPVNPSSIMPRPTFITTTPGPLS